MRRRPHDRSVDRCRIATASGVDMKMGIPAAKLAVRGDGPGRVWSKKFWSMLAYKGRSARENVATGGKPTLKAKRHPEGVSSKVPAAAKMQARDECSQQSREDRTAALAPALAALALLAAKERPDEWAEIGCPGASSSSPGISCP